MHSDPGSRHTSVLFAFLCCQPVSMPMPHTPLWWHSLRHGILERYLLGQGEQSKSFTGLAMFQGQAMRIMSQISRSESGEFEWNCPTCVLSCSKPPLFELFMHSFFQVCAFDAPGTEWIEHWILGGRNVSLRPNYPGSTIGNIPGYNLKSHRAKSGALSSLVSRFSRS